MEAGHAISHYKLLEPLGRGAMGEVWLAEDTQLPRQVAVKLLAPHLSRERDAVDRLLREARAAASVEHPGVVTVFEAGMDADRPYLVMQRVQGETLRQRLDRGSLTVREAVELARKIADALAEVHAIGIVHRDLKPSNVILGEHGPKILDFGVASVKDAPDATRTMGAVGTPLTMAPEQMRGLAPDNRSDLWALGVMLYEMLTGSPPFPGGAFEEVRRRVLEEEPPAVRTLRPEVPVELEFIVRKLLRKEAAHRYGRAEDLLADFANLESSPATRTVAARPETPRIAVLYFEVLGGGEEDSYLAAGLTDDLIVDLTRLEGVRVASRAEVSIYRDRVVPPRTVGRETGADYVVTGSIRRLGDRLRINAQLVRAADGNTLWAERYNRTLNDLFEVQEEVSKSIVSALRVALRPGEEAVLTTAPSRNPQAYAFYLQARELIVRRNRSDFFRAEDLLRKAVELDPEFALAFAALGESIAGRIVRWMSDESLAPDALAFASRALELDPNLLEGHFVRAVVLRIQGKPQEIVDLLEPLVQDRPDAYETRELLGLAYLVLRQPERALPYFQDLVDRYPKRHNAFVYLEHTLRTMGRVEESRKMNERTLELCMEILRHQPDDAFTRTILANALIERGDADAGLKQFERAIAADPEDARNRYNLVCAYSRLGRIDDAMREFRVILPRSSKANTDWVMADPDLQNLRAAPQFQELIATYR